MTHIELCNLMLKDEFNRPRYPTIKGSFGPQPYCNCAELEKIHEKAFAEGFVYGLKGGPFNDI